MKREKLFPEQPKPKHCTILGFMKSGKPYEIPFEVYQKTFWRLKNMCKKVL